MRKLCFLLMPFLLAACEDSADGDIGSSLRPNDDDITTAVDSVFLATETVSVDSVYADNSTFLAGSFTDETFGTIESSLLAQAINPARSAFVAGSVADELVLKVHASAHHGSDECTFYVYPMTKKLDYRTKYYTNIQAKDFTDLSTQIGTKSISRDELAQIDSANKKSASYIFAIPFEKSVAESFVSDLNVYESEDDFLNFFKGFCLKTDNANQLVTIDSLSLSLRLHYENEGETVYDTLSFPVNNEVRQVNKISAKTADAISAKSYDAEYIFSPAGLFTKVQIPLRRIIEKRIGNNDKDVKFNSVFLKIEAQETSSELGKPANLLLIRESEIKKFFEQKQKPDGEKSFYASLTTDAATKDTIYSFNMTNYLQNLLDNAAKSGDFSSIDEYDTMMLVPVRLIYTNSTLSQVQNSFVLSALSLKNSKSASPLSITMIYSEFYKFEK